MSHGHGRGKKRGGHEEEHENHERWAVSYADMMTVLMALFLVLFAMSNIDVTKYEALRTSLADGFGNESLPSSGGSGIMDGSTGAPVDVGADASAVSVLNQSSGGNPAEGPAGPGSAGAGDMIAAQAEASRLKAIQAQIDSALAASGLQDAVTSTINERGLQVSVIANDIFFQSGSATIQPIGFQILDAIGPVVAGLAEDVSVEGHTNDLAISSAQYPSNWELSSGRASSVVRYLISNEGVAGSRLSVKGLAEEQPLYAADDPRAVEGNRRVDIIVLSNASDSVKALLPTVAGESTQSDPTTGTPSSGIATADAAPLDIATDIAPVISSAATDH